MTDKLDPAEVLRNIDTWVNIVVLPAREAMNSAARLIRQMQEAMVEADRRAKDVDPFHLSKPVALRIAEPLAPFLPKPDPLVEALDEAFPISFSDTPMNPEDVDVFRAELARRGLKIVEI